jgi:hypothetical protein
MIATSTPPPTGTTPAETEADRAARLAHERVLLEQAREDVEAGRVIADEDIDAWLDRFAGGEPLPTPNAPPEPGIG